jgi:hypothetical protein
MTAKPSRFDELLLEMKRLHDAKRADYAPEDELGNFRLAELAGVPAWVGILVRLTDKLSRACAYAKTGRFAVNGEGLRDTLIDTANYALLCLIAYEERRVGEEDR